MSGAVFCAKKDGQPNRSDCPPFLSVFLSVAVMSETGCNDDIAILFFVDDAMGVVDSPTPPSAQITSQRLGFSDALIGVSLDVLYRNFQK